MPPQHPAFVSEVPPVRVDKSIADPTRVGVWSAQGWQGGRCWVAFLPCERSELRPGICACDREA